jgi:hypothetical protein
MTKTLEFGFSWLCQTRPMKAADILERDGWCKYSCMMAKDATVWPVPSF